MTEQNASETLNVETPAVDVQVPPKRFRFTRKQIAITAAAAAAAVTVVVLKVKSSASKHTDETNDVPNEANETDASV